MKRLFLFVLALIPLLLNGAVPTFQDFNTNQFGTGTNRVLIRDRALGFVNAKDHGAIGDGPSHPLSSLYSTLAEAQAVYSFATNLSQELDFVACKKASNAALGADSVEHADANRNLNIPIYIPAGNYNFGNDTWTIRNAVGISIYGDGCLTTTIRGNKTILAFDGLWFSTVEKLSFQSVTTGAIAALDVDGNVPGHPYATRSVQGNTFSDLLIDGGGSSYAFAMTRQGSSGAQGSENLYLRVHLSNAALACYYQLGFNALANQFFGGNCQNYSKNGIQNDYGSLNVYGVGFQSTKSYTQILNDGWDIVSDVGGSYDPFIISGCRTESLRFAKLGGSTPGVIIGCKGQPATAGWFASQAYTLNQAVMVTNAALPPRNHLFKVTTDGTTGGTQPVWSTDGSTIADGTAVWQEVVFNAIDNGAGSVIDSAMPVGRIVKKNLRNVEIQANYTAYEEDEIILANTSAGNITVTLPTAQAVTTGKLIYIKKGHVNNTLTVSTTLFEDVTATRTIPAGSYGYLIATSLGGGVLAQRWFILGQDLGSAVPGADTQVIFNDAGVEAGDADFTWDKTSNILSATRLIVNDGTNNPTSIQFSSVPGTGFFRDQSGGLNASVSGSSILRFLGTGLRMQGELEFSLGEPHLTVEASQISNGNDSPEGVVAANIGSIYLRRNGGSGTSFYVKESGSGDTGWVAYGSGGSGSLAAFQQIGSGTDYNLTDTFARVVFGTSGADIVLTNAGTYQIIMTVAAFANNTFAQQYYLRNSTDSTDVPGSYQEVNVSSTSSPLVLSVLYTTSAANKTIQLWGKTMDLTYAGAPRAISTNTVAVVTKF